MDGISEKSLTASYLVFISIFAHLPNNSVLPIGKVDIPFVNNQLPDENFLHWWRHTDEFPVLSVKIAPFQPEGIFVTNLIVGNEPEKKKKHLLKIFLTQIHKYQEKLFQTNLESKKGQVVLRVY